MTAARDPKQCSGGGRTDGRTGGQADGRANVRAGGRDQKMSIFYCNYCKYWCLSSQHPVSSRRDESKCHQVCIFPNQNECATCGLHSWISYFIRQDPFSASTVWGTTPNNYEEKCCHQITTRIIFVRCCFASHQSQTVSGD